MPTPTRPHPIYYYCLIALRLLTMTTTTLRPCDALPLFSSSLAHIRMSSLRIQAILSPIWISWRLVRADFSG
ncbi:hypothetical protein C8R46DRAFT_519161 [Mycena filopes]|nr:hypothetical protein C8R46DRAFT_519161 [Mycena filopes]